jgi:hypothetical protein
MELKRRLANVAATILVAATNNRRAVNPVGSNSLDPPTRPNGIHRWGR